MRIILTALFLIASSAAAFAQSSTATSTTGAAKPVSPPVSGPIGQSKSKIPPAARSGESGLRVGEGAATGDPIEVKRMK